MDTIGQLKLLESLIWFYPPGDENNRLGWSPCDDIRFKEALHEAWPKLLAVVEAAEEYFNDEAGEFNPKYFPKRAAVQQALKALHES